jgi:hypothetical protein
MKKGTISKEIKGKQTGDENAGKREWDSVKARDFKQKREREMFGSGKKQVITLSTCNLNSASTHFTSGWRSVVGKNT